MTTSIRATILNSLSETEREYVTNQYNNILGNAVSALEKRESFAVEQVVRQADNQYGYGDQATALFKQVGLNTSAVVEDEPEFLQAGDNQPPLVTSPYVEVPKPPYTEEDAQAHIDSSIDRDEETGDGEESGPALAEQGLSDYYHLNFEVERPKFKMTMHTSMNGLSKKKVRKLARFISSL